MSSTRVGRGAKARFLFCLSVLLVAIVIICCFNMTFAHLDELRKNSDLCHQQEENLSTQLQVIFDYKQRLEKSLKTERAEHQQTKKILEAKLDEEHNKNEKALNEANLKLSSLQQHYTLLKAQHDDFSEECSKAHQQQLDEINALQDKLKEVQGQSKQAITAKENSLEHLKSQYMQLQVEKENLEQQIRKGQNKDTQADSDINHLTKVNHELQRELDSLKAKCSILTKVEESPIGPQNQIVPPANISNQDDGIPKQGTENKQELINVADLPSNVNEENQSANQQLLAPKTEKIVINNDANVLALPNDINLLPSNQRTSSTTAKSSLAVAQPLHVPAVTLSNGINNKPSEESHIQIQDQHVLPAPLTAKKVPPGVVPVPETNLEIIDKGRQASKPNVDEKDIREDVNNAFPNRYRNNLILNEMANEAKAKEEYKQQKLKDDNKAKPKVDAVDVDNAANAAIEEVDPPVNNNVDPFALDDVHDSNKANIKQSREKVPKQHINALGGEHLKVGKPGHKVYDGPDGADEDIQNGVPVEENDPEAEDDDPDYADPIARQKDVAVRN